ncbi:MAG: peptide chain release factor N(5)-glutamine methyltransferase [Alphaproteobacteria bacterium]|nr:peptide chain release factor N(5)-glutamine methyltransferase [Alphaproteobacteria bacterium]
MDLNIYQKTINELIEAKIPSPRLEARILIAKASGTDANCVYSSTELTDEQLNKLYAMIDERKKHKPLDKIVGVKGFYRYDFFTSVDVLSPRPDTEILVEEAIKIINANNLKTLLDLGTGSGCIVLSILAQCEDVSALAVDISDKALKIAQKNAEQLDLTDRCKFINANWFDADFESKLQKKYDIIVSNPPYIPTEDIKTLEPEVKNFDPLLALDGGKDGLESYKQIAIVAKEKISLNGYVLIEAGINQAQDIVNIFTAQGFTHIASVNDLNFIPRTIVFKA